MRRWVLGGAGATLALGLIACGAKVVVIPVPPDMQNSTTASTQPNGSGSNGGGHTGSAKATSTSAPSKIQGEGVFYALPRTVARVVVKVDKVVTQSAPYARFAPIFAPGAEPPCGTIAKCAALKGKGDTVKYELQEGATFATFGEPDPDKVFMVKFTGGGALDQALSMVWNEAGLLSTASASVTNRTTDIVMSGVKLATSLTTKAAAGGGDVRTATDLCNGNGSTANDTWIISVLSPPALAPNASTPQANAPDSAGPARGPMNTLVANYCELPPTDREGRAGEDSRDDYDETRDRELLIAARRSYLLRVDPLVTQRMNLLTTSTIQVLDPLKYVEKLETLIDEQVKDLFAGSKNTKSWEIPFEVRELTPGRPQEIIGVSEGLGVCPKTEFMAPDAKPAPDGFAVLEDGKCPSTASVSTSYHPEQKSQLFSRIKANVEEPTDERSFRYILPAQVKATLEMKKKTYGTGTFAVAQLGHMVSLPARRNAKTISYDLAMIEATGGLKTFKLGTTGALDAATIDALSVAGGTVIDARNARRKEAEAEAKEAATAADELTILTRQHSLLKLKDEICQLQKKYGLACTIQP